MLEREVKIGGLYRHFKGHIYEVIAIAKDSENLKDKVIYKNIDTNELWVRDKKNFLSLLDKSKYTDVCQKYRFELISENAN